MSGTSRFSLAITGAGRPVVMATTAPAPSCAMTQNENTPMSKQTGIAWAAGLFDGEGCVSIGYIPPSKRNDLLNPSYRLMIKVTMGCKETVHEFGRIVGQGTFQDHVSKKKRVNASYSWIAMSRKAERVLILLRPYLITKVKEADVALQFMALPDGRTGGAGGCQPLDPKLLLARHLLYLKCCELKPRWRFRKRFPSRLPEKPRVSRWVTKRESNAEGLLQIKKVLR